jgi:hypothetical protein
VVDGRVVIVGRGMFGGRRQGRMNWRRGVRKTYRHRGAVLIVSCERRGEVVDAIDLEMVGFVVMLGKERSAFLRPCV